MIKIAHEAPLSIMKEVQKLTDYDYALVHLFEKKDVGEEYLRFFDEALASGREVYLDNSVFELGKAFDREVFRSWVRKLKPTYYIIPDVLRDAQATINTIRRWDGVEGCKTIGVVQGIALDELVECYRYVSDHCDMVAFPFNLPIYLSLSSADRSVDAYCEGRGNFIDLLVEKGVLHTDRPHHLLGTVLPQEVCRYTDEKYSFIRSIDTSNPVVHGIHRVRYGEDGLHDKIQIKLHTLMDEWVDEDTWEDVRFNIEKYGSFAGK